MLWHSETTSKNDIAPSILRTLLHRLHSPLIHIVRIKKINFSDSEGEGEYAIFNAKLKDLRGREDLIKPVTHQS